MFKKWTKDLYIIFFLFLFLIGAVFYTNQNSTKEALKIAFIGDSITQQGWEIEYGYIHQIISSLSVQGIKVKPIPAGAGGETSADVLLRLSSDVLKKKPDIVFLMCGINDIWKGKMDFDETKNNFEKIVFQIKEKNIDLIIVSISIIGENVKNNNNLKVNKYNKYLKELAKKNNLLFIDTNAALKQELKKYKHPRHIITLDGVHLNEKGNRIFSNTIVENFLANYKH